jgi:hypothetical protein
LSEFKLAPTHVGGYINRELFRSRNFASSRNYQRYENRMIVFLNGQFVPEAQAVVPVNDRGFLYGDGLFETLRVRGGRPFRMAQHLERMTRGADFLKIKCPFTPKELVRILRNSSSKKIECPRRSCA